MAQQIKGGGVKLYFVADKPDAQKAFGEEFTACHSHAEVMLSEAASVDPWRRWLIYSIKTNGDPKLVVKRRKK